MRHVALLRGINVGSAKRVAMADLRKLLEGLGYRGVRTLLNSGNAVFEAPTTAGGGHGRRIQEAIAAKLGVDCHVVVKSAVEFDAIVAGNPLLAKATDPARLLVAFASDRAGLAFLSRIETSDGSPDALAVGKHAAYLWCPNGVLRSKLGAAVLRELGERATTRNWATVEKLHAMLRT